MLVGNKYLIIIFYEFWNLKHICYETDYVSTLEFFRVITIL